MGIPGRSQKDRALWPTTMARWAMPNRSTSLDGLGGGLAWAQEPELCASLLPRFESEAFVFFGYTFFSFVNCEEITSALLGGFAVWAANHAHLSFFAMSDECAAAGAAAAGTCPLAEVLVATGDNPSGTPLEVGIEADASSISRVTLTFDKQATCYYMDGTICDALRGLGAELRPTG